MKNAIIGFVIVAALSYGFTKWMLHREVAKGVDMAVMMMAPFAMVQYEGVSSTLTGELTFDGIRARVKGFDDEIFIDRLGIDTPSFFSLIKLGDVESYANDGKDALPEYFGVIAERVRMPVDADYGEKLYAKNLEKLGVSDADEPANLCTGKYGLSPEALKGMGYSEQVFSVSAHFRQLGSRYAVELKSSIENMWEIDAELVLLGDMMTEFAKGPRYRPKMVEMRIEYTDRSLQERTKKFCRRLGLSDDEVLNAQISAFRFMGLNNNIVFDEYVMKPYMEFLAGKSTLVVTAKPAEPIILSQIKLYNAADVPALLNLSAEAL